MAVPKAPRSETNELPEETWGINILSYPRSLIYSSGKSMIIYTTGKQHKIGFVTRLGTCLDWGASCVRSWNRKLLRLWFTVSGSTRGRPPAQKTNTTTLKGKSCQAPSTLSDWESVFRKPGAATNANLFCLLLVKQNHWIALRAIQWACFGKEFVLFNSF